MKIKSILLGVCVFFIGGAMSLSNASTVIVDLSGPLSIKEKISFSAGGVNFYATAFSGNSDSWVNQSGPGLGVSSNLLEPIKAIDGTGRNDLLWLTFQTDVTLLSATFSRVDDNDNFVLLAGEHFTPVWSDYISGNNPYDFTKVLSPSELTGRYFGFTVTERNDDYFLSSIKFASTPVPAPGSVVLLLSGLAGLIFVRRRRAG